MLGGDKIFTAAPLKRHEMYAKLWKRFEAADTEIFEDLKNISPSYWLLLVI